MHKARLEDMVRGWFVGNFEPTLYKTGDVEVGVKHYKAGDAEEWHYHKIATEITVILEGEVEMNGVRHVSGDILTISPGEGTDFRAVTDVTTVVVKLPGASNDKYLQGQ
ncbi:MAG: hypothetical protein QM758_03045 [Armatimonas sp.]